MSVDYELFNKSIANLKDANKDALIDFFNEYDGTPKTLRTLKKNPKYRFINDDQNSSGVIGLFESINNTQDYDSIKKSLITNINSVIPGNAASDSSTSSQNFTNNDDNTDNQNIVNLINAILKTIHDNPESYDYGTISFKFRNENPKDKPKLNKLLDGLKQFMDLPENKKKKASDLETTFWKNSLLTLGASTMPQQTNCDALKQEIANLRQQLAQSQQDAKTCQDALKKFEVDKLQELKKLQQELDASRGLNANSAQLQADLTDAQRKLEDETARANRLAQEKATLEQERDALKKKLDAQADLEAKLAALRLQLTDLQNKGALSDEDRQKLAELQALIKQNEQEKQRLEAQIAAQQAEIKKHAAALAAQQAAHEEALRIAQQAADAAVAAAEAKLSDAEARLNAELEQIKFANDKLNADLVNITGKRDQLKIANDKLNAEKITLETTIAGLNDRIKQLEAAASNGKSQEEQNFLKRISELESLNAELAGKNAGLKTANEAMEATIVTKNTRITQLEGELAAATAKITELGATVADLQRQLAAAKTVSGTETVKDVEINGLRTDLAAKEAELNTLKNTTIPVLEKQIADLTSERNDLKSQLDVERAKPTTAVPAVDPTQIATLTAEKDAAIKERDANQRTIDDLTRQLDVAKEELSKLQSQISASADEQTIADLQAQLKASEDKVVSLNQQITELQEALSECTNKSAPTTEIKSQSGTNIALNQGMAYIFQETRPLKSGGGSAIRDIKLQGENLFVEDDNHIFQKFDQKFYKDMYVGGEDENVETPHEIDPRQIIEAVKNLIPKS